LVDRLYVDSLTSGRRFCTFNVIDDFNREALVIDIDTSLPSSRVVQTLRSLHEDALERMANAGPHHHN